MSTWAPPTSPPSSPPASPTGRGDAPAGAPRRARGRALGNLVAGVVAAAALAAVVAVASRAGGLPGDADLGRPEQSELLPRVVLGALVAAGLAFGITYAGHLRFAPRLRSGRRRRFGRTVSRALPLIALAAGLGALAGASTTPLRQLGAITRDAGVTLTARPVDADRDGRVDVDPEGRAVLGLDVTGDGQIDRVLAPCPGAKSLGPADVEAAARPGADRVQVSVDTDCDGFPERIVYLDPTVAPVAPDAIQPNAPDDSLVPLEVIDRSVSRVRGLMAALAVVALAVLAALVVTAVVLALRGVRVRPADEEPRTRTLLAVDDAAFDRTRAAEAFGESIDAMLTDPDPRMGIIGAYAKLLEGLDRAGLPRRPEEAPLEHLRRCLATLRVPPDPLERLTDLFVLARFSTHPMHEGHRLDALDALRAGLGHLAEAPEPAGRAR